MKTNDVILLDDGETWGGPGRVIRIPSDVEARFKDELDNGSIEEVVKDQGSEILSISGLVAMYDYLKRTRAWDPKMRVLLDGALEFKAKLLRAGATNREKS